MFAVRQHRLGGPDVLVVEEVADPEPARDQVRIVVEAAGVHLVDTVIRRGEFHTPTPLPMTPGREVAGHIDAVGPGADETWIGQRAVAHLGQANGGYAQLAVADAASVHAIPDGLTAELAVAAIGTGRTATGVLDLAPMSSDDVAVVTAASGGLGALLVREARRVRATVIGLAGGPDKAHAVRDLGADAVVDSRAESWEADLASALGGREPTLVYDGVGEPTSSVLYRMLAPGGALVSYTGAEADAFDDPARRFVPVLGPALTARPGGLRSLEAEALTRAADGSRVPLTGQPFALRDVAEAHRALEERRTIGKVLLDPRVV